MRRLDSQTLVASSPRFRRQSVRPLPVSEQLVHGQADVARDLPQQRRRNIATRMKRYGGAAIRMTILTVGTALSGEGEAAPLQQSRDLAGLQDWDGAQGLPDLNHMRTDELRLELRFAVLQQERHDFLKVGEQFVHGGALGMGARPAGDVADK
jgi:hypothetical protein